MLGAISGGSALHTLDDGSLGTGFPRFAFHTTAVARISAEILPTVVMRGQGSLVGEDAIVDRVS